MKVVNKTGPSVDPCGKSLLIGLQLGFLTYQHSLGYSDSFKCTSLSAYLSHCFSGFSLINSCWLLLVIFLSFMCLAVFFRINCSMSSPRIKVRLTSLKFTRTSFLHFLKTGETFAFLQYFGISPRCPHQYWPIDLHLCSLLKRSMSWSFSTKGMYSNFQSFPYSLWPQIPGSQTCW